MFSDFKRAGTKMGRKSTYPRTNRNPRWRIVGKQQEVLHPKWSQREWLGKQGRARLVASGQWCNIYGPEKEGTLSRQ